MLKIPDVTNKLLAKRYRYAAANDSVLNVLGTLVFGAIPTTLERNTQRKKPTCLVTATQWDLSRAFSETNTTASYYVLRLVVYIHNYSSKWSCVFAPNFSGYPFSWYVSLSFLSHGYEATSFLLPKQKHVQETLKVFSMVSRKTDPYTR